MIIITLRNFRGIFFDVTSRGLRPRKEHQKKRKEILGGWRGPRNAQRFGPRNTFLRKLKMLDYYLITF
jgi:hypothetical protein